VISDTGPFLVVLAMAALAPLIAAGLTKGLRGAIVPIAVVELVLGAALGPHGANWGHDDRTVNLLGDLGLGFLFFFAGYEVDFERIRGTPMRLAVIGWIMSCAIAYAFAGLLAAAGLVISGILTGSAMSTTALGTILPSLRDAGQLEGKFGREILSAGAVGELGPVIIVTLLLTAESNTASQALLLAGFIVVTILAALISSGAVGRAWGFLNKSLYTSGQEPVRLTVVLVVALLVLANELGLDVILGAFAAGVIVRFVLRDREAHIFESKIEAVGFGFLIPFFFIQSGMKLDLGALSTGVEAVMKVPIFLAGFLLVRGLPALVLYRGELGRYDRLSLAFLSATQLPLVVAITSIGLAEGKMRPSTAVALVTAGVLSVLIFPTVGLVLRTRGELAAAAPSAAERAATAQAAETARAAETA
jgi:Kef-type K+ transport system membrane component KefB